MGTIPGLSTPCAIARSTCCRYPLHCANYPNAWPLRPVPRTRRRDPCGPRPTSLGLTSFASAQRHLRMGDPLSGPGSRTPYRASFRVSALPGFDPYRGRYGPPRRSRRYRSPRRSLGPRCPMVMPRVAMIDRPTCPRPCRAFPHTKPSEQHGVGSSQRAGEPGQAAPMARMSLTAPPSARGNRPIDAMLSLAVTDSSLAGQGLSY